MNFSGQRIHLSWCGLRSISGHITGQRESLKWQTVIGLAQFTGQFRPKKKILSIWCSLKINSHMNIFKYSYESTYSPVPLSR